MAEQQQPELTENNSADGGGYYVECGSVFGPGVIWRSNRVTWFDLFRGDAILLGLLESERDRQTVRSHSRWGSVMVVAVCCLWLLLFLLALAVILPLCTNVVLPMVFDVMETAEWAEFCEAFRKLDTPIREAYDRAVEQNALKMEL